MPCCTAKTVTRHSNNYYRPNYRYKALTEKFYARHEAFDFDSNLLNSPKVDNYVDLITQYHNNTLRNRSLAPITENQKYGWLLHMAYGPQDEMDYGLLHYGRRDDSQIKLIAIIDKEKRWFTRYE
ncbi:unnamed protein product [Ceratitis capitata]|uniref:(Mediterranean fruit fly) hypothetical protein n=1 Tax=Ceratitis capitata TaxID=7213 RepID=A0A811U2V9_CERCA|nr:unnamed protein product [Ceratitis capitata]